MQLTAEIKKFNDEERMVYGFASVAKDGDTTLVDRQGDMIEEAELVKMAHRFIKTARTGKVMHEGTPKAEVVESMVLRPDVAKALGLENFTKTAWVIGMKVNDDATWDRVKKGELKAFSIGGKGKREPVQKDGRRGRDGDGDGEVNEKEKRRGGGGAALGAVGGTLFGMAGGTMLGDRLSRQPAYRAFESARRRGMEAINAADDDVRGLRGLARLHDSEVLTPRLGRDAPRQLRGALSTWDNMSPTKQRMLRARFGPSLDYRQNLMLSSASAASRLNRATSNMFDEAAGAAARVRSRGRIGGALGLGLLGGLGAYSLARNYG